MHFVYVSAYSMQRTAAADYFHHPVLITADGLHRGSFRRSTNWRLTGTVMRLSASHER